MILSPVNAQFLELITREDTDIYMFLELPTDTLKMVRNDYQQQAGTVVQLYVPSDTVTVYGVALTMYNVFFDGLLPIEREWYTISDYRAVLMERGGPDTIMYFRNRRPLRTIDSVGVNTLGRIKHCSFRYDGLTDPYNPSGFYISPCYEFYFDTPQVVMDTFYVGRFCSIVDQGYENVFCAKEPRATYDIGPSGWYHSWVDGYYENKGRYWGFAFPIIGFRCKLTDDKLLTPRLIAMSDSGATVQWDNVEIGTTYNVRLASTDGSVDTIFSTSDTTYTFDGLPQDKCYTVRVRKQCYYATATYDTLVYSSWTSCCASFILGDTTTVDTSSTGIILADGVYFSVSPNPAHSAVEVTLPRPLESDGTLVLYDLGGQEVRQRVIPAGSRTAVVDTRDCSAGAYLLRLITPQGVATRRLLVK